MLFELPAWAWLGVAWLLTSVCLAAGIARWFRFMRDDDPPEWHG